MSRLLKNNLEPTDFADAVCRVTDWIEFEGYKCTGYRIWVCKCTNHWFSRHEWIITGQNQTQIDDWLYSGFYINKDFKDHEIYDGLKIIKEMNQ